MSVLVIFTKLIWLLIMLSRIACLVDLSLALPQAQNRPLA